MLSAEIFTQLPLSVKINNNNNNKKMITSVLVFTWKCPDLRSTLEVAVLDSVLMASVAQLDAPSDWRPGGRGFNPRRGRQHSFMEIDHEIFSAVILSLPLIQEGQLSVSGERMCTILVNCLEDKACPVNVWLGKLTALEMTPLGWLGCKTSTQTNSVLLPLCSRLVKEGYFVIKSSIMFFIYW